MAQLILRLLIFKWTEHSVNPELPAFEKKESDKSQKKINLRFAKVKLRVSTKNRTWTLSVIN